MRDRLPFLKGNRMALEKSEGGVCDEAQHRAAELHPAEVKPGFRKQKTPPGSPDGVFLITSLTITYFHTGCSTIIGAKSFHGPVRDGKGWDRLAMVIRHDLYEQRSGNAAQNLEEVKWGSGDQQTHTVFLNYTC
jgi:hypothetical protein